jgi:hypothetical protein
MNCQGSARLRHSLAACTYLLQEVPSAYLLAPDLESLYPIELYDRLPVVPEVLTILQIWPIPPTIPRPPDRSRRYAHSVRIAWAISKRRGNWLRKACRSRCRSSKRALYYTSKNSAGSWLRYSDSSKRGLGVYISRDLSASRKRTGSNRGYLTALSGSRN